eukprot:3932462-Rhodomonas_salina.1
MHSAIGTAYAGTGHRIANAQPSVPAKSAYGTSVPDMAQRRRSSIGGLVVPYALSVPDIA